MKLAPVLFALLFATITLSSCGAVETIFKAGMWWAFFLIALVVIVGIVLVNKMRK